MTEAHKNRQKEVDENYQAFVRLLPDLIQDHEGEFLVIRHKKPVKYFNTIHEATVYAVESYDDGLFSVQEVTQKAIDLGWFSYAPVHNPLPSG